MKKLFLLCAIVLVASLTSCISDSHLDNNGTPTYDNIALTLRIVQQSDTRGVSRPIPDDEQLILRTGDLFLVNAAGTIIQHYAIVDGATATCFDTRIINRTDLGDGTGSDVNTSGITLPAVPGNVTEVVIIGNTSNNPTQGYINSNAIGGRLIDVVTQYDAWHVNLFGSDGLERSNPLRLHNNNRIYTANVFLEPSVARVELGSIIAASDIASFSLEGIFVNNYYRHARINRTLLTDWVNNLPSDPHNNMTYADAQRFVRGSTTYPSAFSPALFDWYAGGLVATGTPLSVSPDDTDNVWSYQVFATNSSRAPQLVIRLRNVRIEDWYHYLPDPQFLVVNLFYNTEGDVLDGITAGGVYRAPVVAFNRHDLIGVAPEPEPSIHVHVTTFTGVMYDFQSQMLETFVEVTAGNITPTSWQWQVSNDNINFVNVNLPCASGETFATAVSGIQHATWMLPENFIFRFGTPIPAGIPPGNLYFRTVVTTADGGRLTQTPNNTLRIRFIQTTRSGRNDFLPGFGMDATQTRYAIMTRANHSRPGISSGTSIRVALLNEGANDYDGGLGYLFQWGRRADGHQRIGWFNDLDSHLATFTPGVVGAGGVVTSAAVDRPTGTFNANGQVPFGNAAYGHFILSGTGATENDWSTRPNTDGSGVGGNRNLWGGGMTPFSPTQSYFPLSTTVANQTPTQATRANVAITLFNTSPWAARARDNNPCPPGWRVPSHFDFTDMHMGDGGNEDGSLTSTSPVTGAHNLNVWTVHTPRTTERGGVIVTNTRSGASVFLPSVTSRAPATGNISATAAVNVETGVGRYQTSTQVTGGLIWPVILNTDNNTINVPRNTNVTSTNAQGSLNRSNGMSVRCVR